MTTKKEEKKDGLELKTELYGICLDVEYSVSCLESLKGDMQEEIKSLTQTLTKAKRKLEAVKKKYKIVTGREFSSSKRG